MENSLLDFNRSFLHDNSHFKLCFLDQSVSISSLKEGYKDTEWDLEQISEVIKGKLRFEDFKTVTDRYPELEDSTSIDLNRIKIIFDNQRKIKSVTTEW